MKIINGGNEKNFISFFTLFHFIAGIIGRILKIPIMYFFILHILFELGENVFIRIKKTGDIIRKIEKWYLNILKNITKHMNFYIKIEEEYYGDSLINSMGDTIFAILGWILTEQLINGYKTKS